AIVNPVADGLDVFFRHGPCLPGKPGKLRTVKRRFSAQAFDEAGTRATAGAGVSGFRAMTAGSAFGLGRDQADAMQAGCQELFPGELPKGQPAVGSFIAACSIAEDFAHLFESGSLFGFTLAHVVIPPDWQRCRISSDDAPHLHRSRRM